MSHNIPSESDKLLLHDAITNNDMNKIQQLLQNGFDIHTTNQHGFSPLHMAAWSNNIQAIQILVDAGIDVNIQDENSNTPFTMLFFKIMSMLSKHF